MSIFRASCRLGCTRNFTGLFHTIYFSSTEICLEFIWFEKRREIRDFGRGKGQFNTWYFCSLGAWPERERGGRVVRGEQSMAAETVVSMAMSVLGSAVGKAASAAADEATLLLGIQKEIWYVCARFCNSIPHRWLSMAPPRRRVGDLGFHGRRRRRRLTALLRRNFFFGLLVIPTDSGSKMKQSGEPIHASHFTTPNLWIVTMQTKIPSVSYFHMLKFPLFS